MRITASRIGSLFVFGIGIALGGCASQTGDHTMGDGYATTSSDSEALTVVCGAHTNGPVQGVDVSYYQGNFNWAGAHVQFGAARISDGSGFIDPDFASNWSKMKAAGVIRSAYQFFEPGENEVTQANLVISKVGKLGAGDLPVMLDIEVTGGQSPSTIRTRAQHWLDMVEAGTGKRPFVYSYGSFLETNLGSGFGKYPLWIANYGPVCPSVPSGWSNWKVWQYSDGGGSLDHDVFNGTLAELKAFAGELPPRGYLDAASCSTITGWAQDQPVPTTSIDVTVTVDATLGHTGTGSFNLVANATRTDLKTAIGSENHGFSIATPLSLLDTEAHHVYAYGVPITSGLTTTLLTNAPKAITCPYATAPLSAEKAVKRHIVSSASLTSWKLSRFFSLAPETAATVAAYPDGDDFPTAPEVVKSDDGSAAVYVIDGAVKRHVVNKASLSAWHLTVTTMTAAKLDAIPQGPDWLLTPFLMEAVGAPEVYAIDLAPATAPGSEPSGEDGESTSESQLPTGLATSVEGNTSGQADDGSDATGANAGSGGGASESSGCSVTKGGRGSKDGEGAIAIFGLALGIAAARKRRSSARARRA